MDRRRKFWGWGYEDQRLTPGEQRMIRAIGASQFKVAQFEETPVPQVGEIALARPRLSIPRALAGILTTDPYERLLHTYGRSLKDYIRMFARDFRPAPDLVAYPHSAEDVAAVLAWANDENAAIIPCGGGTSVVGGIEAAVGDGFSGAVSLDLGKLARVVEVDDVSRAARIEAGILGPALEAALKPAGLTLRHFPQSFEFSTLGGWIATRSGGHYATLYTQIDDFVESLRVVTPRGIVETRRLPASGAGPAPDRLFIGSEGALGVITDAWVRLQRRPTFRAAASVHFPTFLTGAEAVRVISQAGLYPANVRLLEPLEGAIAGAGDGSRALLVLAFESADHPVEAALARGLEICADHGGTFAREAEGGAKGGAAAVWRNTFIRMPYFKEFQVAIGILSATFETAITWDRFAPFYAGVKAAAEAAIVAATGKPGVVTCRFTHVYPDGPAPYFTWHAMGHKAALLEQAQAIAAAAADAIETSGGTVTHHHAVGRDHMPWYVKERPALFGAALAAAKAELDPAGLLNPGVLVPARP